MSVLIILSSIGYSFRLIDSSNVIRYTFLTVSLVILFACHIQFKCYTPLNFGIIVFLIFIALQGLSILWATNFGEAIFDFSKWIIIWGIITLTFNGLKKHQVRTICLLSNTAIVIFCISLVATIPQIIQMNGISWYSRYGIISLFTHKGTYSMQLFLFLPFLFMRAILPIKGNWIYWSFITLIIGLIFFIQARAVLLAFFLCIISYLITIIFKKTNKCHIKRTNLVCIFLAFILCFTIVGSCRIVSEKNFFHHDIPSSILSTASMWERQSIWKTTFRLIDKQPFTGCGIGNWKINYPSVSVKDVFAMDILDIEFIRPHNDFLRLLSESGYISLFAFLTALSFVLIALIRNKTNNIFETLKANIFISFLVGIITFAFFDFPFDRMEIILWCSIIGGTAIFSTNSKWHLLSKKTVLTLTTTYLLFTGLGIIRWCSEWNYSKIVYYLPQNKWEKVESYSNHARSIFCNISPSNDPYAYFTGMAREFMGLSSLDDYRLAIKDSPFYKPSLTDLGRVEYLEKHDTLSSINHLKEAIRISPNFSTAYFTLSEIYSREGRKDAALEILYSLDLDKKQQIVNENIRSFYSLPKAELFSRFVIDEEKLTKQELISRITTEQ